MRIMELINKCLDIYKKHKEGFNYLIFGGLTTLLSLLVYYAVTFTFLNPAFLIKFASAAC